MKERIINFNVESPTKIKFSYWGLKELANKLPKDPVPDENVQYSMTLYELMAFAGELCLPGPSPFLNGCIELMDENGDNHIVNMNAEVRVRPIDAIRKAICERNPNMINQFDERGYFTASLWVIFNLFGPFIGNSNGLGKFAFEDQITLRIVTAT